VLATHADQALDLLTDATPAEKAVLGQFEYSRNETVLHTDSSLLPTTKNARACWNYVVRDDAPLTTYWMNRLQGLETEETYLVTLNGAEAVDPAKVIARMEYEHPIYTPKAVAAQSRLAELNTGRVAFAGAYHGWGFHEDGWRAGVAAGESFGVRWVRSSVSSPPFRRSSPASSGTPGRSRSGTRSGTGSTNGSSTSTTCRACPGTCGRSAGSTYATISAATARRSRPEYAATWPVRASSTTAGS